MKIDAKIEREEISKRISKPAFFLKPKKEVVKVELMHIPYYVFEFEVVLKKNKILNRTICVDCITGEHSFIKNSKAAKGNAGIKDSKSFGIKVDEAEKISKAALISSILFEKKKGIEIKQIIIKEKSIMEYPYWIGYYRRRNKLDFEAVDAVNGSLQGAKMRPTFIKLIMQ